MGSLYLPFLQNKELNASDMKSVMEQPEQDQEWTVIDFHEEQPESPAPL